MKYRILIYASLCALVPLVCPAIRAQDEGSIKQAMSPEEFHKAGLDKLTDEELRNLDRWLQGDREKTAQKAVEDTNKVIADEAPTRLCAKPWRTSRLCRCRGCRRTQLHGVTPFAVKEKFNLTGANGDNEEIFKNTLLLKFYEQ